MRWIHAILAYVLLILSCALTLYFLELGGVQEELALATTKELEEQLGQSPELSLARDFIISFTAREGHVTGVATTSTGAKIGREIVERLANEGLPDDAQTQHDFSKLTSDWKYLPSFQLFAQAEEMALRADLAPSTLEKLKTAVRNATGADPGSPIDPDGDQPEPDAVGQEDVEIPDWENTFGAAVQYLLQNKRLKDPELWLTRDQTLRIMGSIDTSESAQTLHEILQDGFHSLAERIDNRVEVKRALPAFDLKVEDGKITLEGAAPSTEIKDELTNYIRDQLPDGQVLAPAIQVIPEAATPVWLRSKPTFFKRVFAEIESPRIIISNGEVMLEGLAPSKTVVDELAKLIQSQLSDHTYNGLLSFPHEPSTP